MLVSVQCMDGWYTSGAQCISRRPTSQSDFRTSAKVLQSKQPNVGIKESSPKLVIVMGLGFWDPTTEVWIDYCCIPQVEVDMDPRTVTLSSVLNWTNDKANVNIVVGV